VPTSAEYSGVAERRLAPRPAAPAATSFGRFPEPDRLDPEPVLREAAELEEWAARAHERAAGLFEFWLRQDRSRSAGLEQRARMHREIAAATRSVERLAERTLRGFQARIGLGTPSDEKGRALLLLAGLERLRVLIDRQIEETVAVGRRGGASWAEIAKALGVTRQTAHQRYR
jgi:hypothetical protein